MQVAIDPVTHSVCGLAGGLYDDYRSTVVGVEELAGGWRRVFLRLTDDMPTEDTTSRKAPRDATVIVPRGLDNYNAYRQKLWFLLERGGSLIDVTL